VTGHLVQYALTEAFLHERSGPSLSGYPDGLM
jgi:hypothetical protein